jgi:hypothetical protein
MEKNMRVSFSKFWGPLLLIVGSACTIKTVDTTPDGGGGSGGTGATGGSGGSGGSSGSSGGSVDAGTETGGTAGAAGSGGAAGSSGGAAGSSGAAGTSGSAGSGGSTGGDAGPDAGSGGSAGSGTGGTAGAAGSGMTDAGAGDGSSGDSCDGPEANPNDDREHATPYALGVATKACLQSVTDLDFYEFTLPSTPVQGGFVKIQITDVGTAGNIEATVFAVHNNGEFLGIYNGTQGGSVFGYFAGKAGATFRIRVGRYTTVGMPTPYTLTATFTGVNDVNEPNDVNAQATPLTIGTPISGYLFAGHEDSSPPAAAAWDDRFKVTLPEGQMTFTLVVPPDMDGQITLFNALGSQIDSQYDGTEGSTVVLKHTVTAEEAGVCYVSVHPWVDYNPLEGEGSTTPGFYSTPYTLTVTGP